VPKISYAYIVSGRKYVGTRYQFTGESQDEADVMRLLSQYPAAIPVTVYYEPGNPGQSVLKAGSNPTDRTIGFLTGGFALCAGFYLIWAGLLSSGFSSTPPEPKPQ
jgi:Protein of unknown function (DUF3592)